jgi:hypothetical protein
MSQPRSLLRHLDSPGLGIRSLDVAVDRQPDGGLILRYTLTGALEALRISAPKPPIREEGLWRTTCLECFIRAGDGPAYREYNFAPSGAWQAYAFSEYRKGEALETEAAPEVRCEAGPLQLCLTARLPAALLPPEPGRMALSAVLQSRDGRLAYWALRHPEGKADFHHNDGFVLNCPRYELPDRP